MRLRPVIAGWLAIVPLLVIPVPAVALLQARLPEYLGPPSTHDLQVRPKIIVWTGDGSGLFAGRGRPRPKTRSFGRLHWTEWRGKSEARAWGANWFDDCSPDCAGGTFTAYAVNLRAFRPAFLAGYYVFTRMTVTYAHGRPSYVKTRSHTWRLVSNSGSYFWCVAGRC